MSSHHHSIGSISEGAAWEVKKGNDQGNTEALRELSRCWSKDGDPSKARFNEVFKEANAQIDSYNKSHDQKHQLGQFVLVDENGKEVNDVKSAKGIQLGDYMEARTLGQIMQPLAKKT
jgi:hypothetical protein